MKANEAPEKIYIPNKPAVISAAYASKTAFDDVEYVRTDVFIEKAVKFIHERLMFEDTRWYKNDEQTLEDKVIEDFKKYMEG